MGVMAWLGIAFGAFVLNIALIVVLVAAFRKKSKLLLYIAKDAAEDPNVPDVLFIALLLTGLLGLPIWYKLYKLKLLADAAREEQAARQRTARPRNTFEQLLRNHYDGYLDRAIRAGMAARLVQDPALLGPNELFGITTAPAARVEQEMGPGEDYSKFGEWFKEHCVKETKSE